jgi:hypothetical protein
MTFGNSISRCNARARISRCCAERVAAITLDEDLEIVWLQQSQNQFAEKNNSYG